MPLTITNHMSETLTGQNVLAHDPDGNRVTISVSHEAIQDFGWEACLDRASDKFDAGDIDTSGTQPKVSVKTSDFAGHSDA